VPDETTPRLLFQRRLNLWQASNWVINRCQALAKPGVRYVASESDILQLHAMCMAQLLPAPGTFRTTPMQIGAHRAPPAKQIPQHIRDLIGHINESWNDSSPTEIAAYSIWRLNWIHPFPNGNGRTSRQFSYLLMGMRAGMAFPGNPGHIVPEMLGGAHRQDYVLALRTADKGDLSPLEQLLAELLTNQLQQYFS